MTYNYTIFLDFGPRDRLLTWGQETTIYLYTPTPNPAPQPRHPPHPATTPNTAHPTTLTDLKLADSINVFHRNLWYTVKNINIFSISMRVRKRKRDQGRPRWNTFVRQYISMADCKIAISPLLTHWRFCSRVLNLRYIDGVDNRHMAHNKERKLARLN